MQDENNIEQNLQNEGLLHSPEQVDEDSRILSYEEFAGKDSRFDDERPMHNNFVAHFYEGLAGMTYGNQDYFLEFKDQNPELYDEIYNKVNDKEMKGIDKRTNPEIVKKLYEAYVFIKNMSQSNNQPIPNDKLFDSKIES